MKLAVYAIAKNEAKHAARWFKSVEGADAIYVLDTGSTDGTQQILQDLGVTVRNMVFDPFRFDTARNASLNLIDQDIDYCMFIDLDETMPEGSIAKIKEAIADGQYDSYGVRLVFSFDEQRNPVVSYTREAIHRRQGFYWKYPVHELLANYEPEYKFKEINVDVYHEPDATKSRSSYLALLETAVEENPDDARQVQYLGREHMYLGNYLDAIMLLRRHIQMETHGPFRAESATYISRCYQAMNGSLEEAMDEAESWLLRAISEFNSAREAYCELAHLYFDCGAYECAIGMLRSALRIEEPPKVMMIHTAMYYGEWPWHMLAACYQALGNNAAAREHITYAMRIASRIDGALANDIATIMGLPTNVNVNQPVAGSTGEEAV